MRSHRWLFLVLLLAVAPAAANTGPPWLFLGFFATWIVPLLLGFIEGGLLQRMIPLSNRRGAAILITANYVSAIFGWATLGLLNLAVGQLPTRWTYLHFPVVLAAVVLLAYLATVLLEWPFHRWAHGQVERPWRAGWRTCLKINLATYVVVAVCFWSLTGIGLYRNARPVADTSFAAGVPAWVYYLSGDEVRHIRLDGSNDQSVMALPQDWRGWRVNGLSYPKLAVLPSEDRQANELWISQRYGHTPLCSRLIDSLPGRGTGFNTTMTDRDEYWYEGYGKGYSRGFADRYGMNGAADLRPSEERGWLFNAGFWAEEGLYARRQTGSSYGAVGFACGTPVLEAYARCATVLPGDFVVWQLGTQIAVLDFPNRRWSILVDGIGPAVVLDGQG